MTLKIRRGKKISFINIIKLLKEMSQTVHQIRFCIFWFCSLA
ncbi:hypothetical protein LEP1GSC047_1814 [Leptospira inadai serovar Lyme str. 10]|uniref:Uncharacterized protein n=1 Tax=Leptospira inadai serovar Lyme str. 10 TaxID=1049790 RepID=V6H8J3_9LEPT|nr:hypothetical protein LEP1GSC047_1814 [Leptospira inadai serovar Lyme str. 10]